MSLSKTCHGDGMGKSGEHLPPLEKNQRGGVIGGERLRPLSGLFAGRQHQVVDGDGMVLRRATDLEVRLLHALQASTILLTEASQGRVSPESLQFGASNSSKVLAEVVDAPRD